MKALGVGGPRLTGEERALLKVISARLRLLRRVSGRSRGELADAVGVPVEVLRLVESGDPMSPLLVVRRLIHEVGVSDWLLTIGIAEKEASRKHGRRL